MFTEADLIYSYTRAQALADGVLVDVTTTSAQAGFRVPVALTAAVWADCVAWDVSARHGLGQSEDGRIWDVVWMAACAARRARDRENPRVRFEVLRVPQGCRTAEAVALVLHIGPGDTGEPVMTVMMPGED